MAKSKVSNRSGSSRGAAITLSPEPAVVESYATLPGFAGRQLSSAPPAPNTTGRYIIIYKTDVTEARISKSLKTQGGISEIASTREFKSGAVPASTLSSASTTVHFANLGIAVVPGEAEMLALTSGLSDADSPILAIEPEYICYFDDANLDYLRGYRDGINHWYDLISEGVQPPASRQPTGLGAAANRTTLQDAFADTDQFTWGLQATRAHRSTFSGQGIKIAVLDTGFSFDHPDFKGRNITAASFSGMPIDDVHSHGTHCIGTACGPQQPASGVRRYGVAYNAQIFAGKVFDNASRPSAPSANVIAGINWALENECDIASLSLGAPVNQVINQYTAPMERALRAGLLVVAAAGNNANRPSNVGFVEPPANSDEVMAIAALDANLGIAPFSARSSMVTGPGGKVDIAAPGVNVFSSIVTGMGLHDSFNGTSMATPHVAGIAGLWAEATGKRGLELWQHILKTARRLDLASADAGIGLVQAP